MTDVNKYLQLWIHVPTVHMNGTARADLLGGYLDSAHAVRSAIDVLLRNGPNGRDYYPQGDNAISKAMRQHRDRIARMQSVLQEIETLYEGVDAQGDGR